MVRWILGTLILGLTLTGVGCKTLPENTYFSMAYALIPNQGGPQNPLPVSLRVRELDITPAYDKERLVYRRSAYQFQYYSYMLWAVKPHRMLTDLIVRHFEHSRMFGAVSREFGDKAPDYELSGVLQSIEELDSGDEWYAHLQFTLRLTRYRDGRVIWSHRMDAKKRVYNKSPVYVVKALSELLEAEMTKIVEELRVFIKSSRKEDNR